MAINKAMVTGTDAVMDWFDRNATSPYYSVWADRKQLLFSWNDDDEVRGRNKLEDDLRAIEQNNNSDVLIIKLHPKKEKGGFVTDKTPINASLNFRLNELERPMYSNMGAMNYPNNAVLEKILETQNAILTRLTAEELEEEEEEQPTGIAGILNSPHVQSLLMAGVSKLLGIGDISGTQSAAIAGIDDLADPNEAIMILNDLINKGVTVEHLRKLNAMPDAQLKSLLMML